MDSFKGKNFLKVQPVLTRKQQPFLLKKQDKNKKTTLKTESLETDSEIQLLSSFITVTDVCCFVMTCSTHQTILLRMKRPVFLPNVKLATKKTWLESSVEGALNNLYENLNDEKINQLKKKLPFRRFACMHVFRFQLPNTQHFVTRLIYLVEVDCNQEKFCSKTLKNFQWYPIEDAVASKIKKVWGPEVSWFSKRSLSKGQVHFEFGEYSMKDALQHLPSDNPSSIEEAILNKANITIYDIERLYADFIEHCFPSFFLTRESFRVYMLKHNIELNHNAIHRYYTAFRYRGKQYMYFHELLFGLACMDSRAPNDELRARLIFRFYDYDKDNYLNVEEFKRMLKIMNLGDPRKITNEFVRGEMKKVGFKIVNNEEMLSTEDFVRAVVIGKKLPTINNLCRAKVSPFVQITRALTTRRLCSIVSQKNFKSIMLNLQERERCSNCLNTKKYLTSLIDVIGFDRKGQINKEYFTLSFESTNSSYFLAEDIYKKYSEFHFILNEIRKFIRSKDRHKPFRGLFTDLNKTEIQVFYENMKIICMEMCTLVENEDRILKLTDPLYVIGDIHGNLEDLISLEQCLWPSFPILTSNYLFLGDYVDRGRFSFECFLYLMIMKILAPNKIFMLRGNHEIRCIQIKYTFYKELIKKYGNVFGQQFFDLYNMVFDRLPVGAIVNNSVFCAHGGIPYTIQNLNQLNQVTPNCLPDPEREAISVWEMIWSDPLEGTKFVETASIQGLKEYNVTFLPNLRRGTSYFFNEYALMDFFKTNKNLRYLIRAHEVPAEGFKFNFGTMCTTIFSCSHYCGADNQCAVALIDRESRIRIIRIDTSMNTSATIR